MPDKRLRPVATAVPGVSIWYDFVTSAEEQYLVQKIDAAGGGPPPTAAAETTAATPASSDPSTSTRDPSQAAATETSDSPVDTVDAGQSIQQENAAAPSSTTPTVRKPSGWKDLNGRRSMYWGGTVTPSGSLVPAPFPGFMESAWPNVLERIAETGVYDEWTGGKGKVKERGPNHCLVNEYLPGKGIMPHTDGPAYLPCTSTLSLGSHTILHLRSKPAHLAANSAEPNSDGSSGDSTEEIDRAASIAAVQKIDLFLPPRSLVVLTGELYSEWLHGIAPTGLDTVESLVACANWDDWWRYQAEAEAEAKAEAEADKLADTDATARTADASTGAGQSEKERRMVEEGKGWERQRRISLTCRRVAGKVRNLGGLLGLMGANGGARRR